MSTPRITLVEPDPADFDDYHPPSEVASAHDVYLSSWPGVDAMRADGWEIERGGPTPRVVMALDQDHRACVGGPVYCRKTPPDRAGLVRGDDADGEAVRVASATFVAIEDDLADRRAMVEYGPITPIRFGRDGGVIEIRRVKAGRYRERLPTNRQRKRARCQENRRNRR